MKNYFFLLILIVFGWNMACQNSNQNLKPEILTAEYSLKSFENTEKFYKINLVIDNWKDELILKSIILKNRRFEKLELNKLDKNKITIDQNFPITSQMIQDFVPPPFDSRKDGIIFDYEGKEIYQEIRFKLK